MFRIMQAVKPAKESNNRWSVTRSSTMMSVELKILQFSSKPKNSVKQGSVCFDKNCQDNKCVNMQASEARNGYVVNGTSKL